MNIAIAFLTLEAAHLSWAGGAAPRVARNRRDYSAAALVCNRPYVHHEPARDAARR